MFVNLVIKGHFDAAHRLEHYVGKCHFMHGHRWNYTLTFHGKVDEESGMVKDFKELKKSCLKPIDDLFDHTYLNDVLNVEPTAENIAIAIFDLVYTKLGNHDLTSVEVFETPDCGVECPRNEYLWGKAWLGDIWKNESE